MTLKRCCTCGVEKDPSEFHPNRAHKDGLSTKCRPCHNAYTAHRYRTNPAYRMRTILRAAQTRAKRLGVPFNLTVEDVPSTPEFCPVLGIKLEIGYEQPHTSPSLDRIVPALGYVKGNIVVVSQLANMIKNMGTITQIRKVADFYDNLSTPANIPPQKF